MPKKRAGSEHVSLHLDGISPKLLSSRLGDKS